MPPVGSGGASGIRLTESATITCAASSDGPTPKRLDIRPATTAPISAPTPPAAMVIPMRPGLRPTTLRQKRM
jgi:hypothetical protein